MTTPNDTPAVTLTESALRRLRTILSGEPPETVFRITVSGGGCSGFQYGFALDRTRNGDDLVLAAGEVTVVVDPVSQEFLGGAEVDFVEELIGASFKVRNPNATASCSCGASFAVG
ncbi:MAG: iron-sulfur cluster insertion protein ErpA [Alphaproteobacteria bacterium]|nr:iron-sulfur cluster insertion protein ErpA [Alphaproteobacteria bacterium]